MKNNETEFANQDEEISYKDMWERLKAILRSDLNLSLNGLRYTLDHLDSWDLIGDADCARRCDLMLELMRDIEMGTEDCER